MTKARRSERRADVGSRRGANGAERIAAAPAEAVRGRRTMTRSYIESREGAANVGAAALVFDLPPLASAPRVARHGIAPASDSRGNGPDRGSREAPESIEEILKIARSHIMRSLFSI